MGKDFTLQKAFDVVREEECVDRALLQLSGVQVGAMSSRLNQDGSSARRIIQDARPYGSCPPQASVQDGTSRTSPSCTSSSSAAADTSSLPSPLTRAGACYRCGSTRHWANSAVSPARSRTCSRCRRCGNFTLVCGTTSESTGHQGTSTATNTFTVLQVDEMATIVELLHLPPAATPLLHVHAKTLPHRTSVARRHRPLCYHCGEAGHTYCCCQYPQMGLRGFAVNAPHPQPGPRPQLTY
ncbi:hypothetical protein HPB51_005105 [Rhipicephalus microplus]|uniref:CCHC-type domain-containing protein n=1 Tax=Rhipicephalus microplus TaxID=6941 RepID=A0A9J6EMQ8_RHIMP|nr:hypothetical protein HPB51_005105 [Rhipicephalus microplus]